MKNENYTPHGFLDNVGVDFEGLEIPSGRMIFTRLGDWVSERGCTHVIMPWMLETTAMLLQILGGCSERVRLTTDERERVVWEKLRKSYAKQSMLAWRQIWQNTAENSVKYCGESALSELCALLPNLERAVLIGGLSESEKRKATAEFEGELSEVPEFWEE